MKRTLIPLLMFAALCLVSCRSAGRQPRLAWEAGDGIDKPESVYYDKSSGKLFVSNISGEGTGKDGKGWISVLDLNGAVRSPRWIAGLNAPKGMRSHKGTLWVTDIDEVLGISIQSGEIISRAKIAGAKFLNDIVVSPDGVAYVSDTIGSAIYRIRDGKISTFLSGDALESPNGLYLSQGKLYVASWGLTQDWSTKTPGRLFTVDLKTKEIVYITARPLGNLDGLEPDGQGGFWVSDWVAGKVYHVGQDGSAETVIEGKKGFADIGLVPEKNLLIVPSMNEHRVLGYSVRSRN